jgi:catalase
MVRSAYALHAEDDDFTQPGNLVRDVFDDDQRDRLVEQVSGSLLGGVRGEVLDEPSSTGRASIPTSASASRRRFAKAGLPSPSRGWARADSILLGPPVGRAPQRRGDLCRPDRTQESPRRGEAR